MTASSQAGEPVVKTHRHGSVVTIELNRPHPLNSLNLDMVRLLSRALERARKAEFCRCVLLLGAGDRAFCAGGDIKALSHWVSLGEFHTAEQFFKEEYALDLAIHQFSKPIVVVADGIVMGGGLGLAAGADVILATEKTRMAMPETNIGFFPDVGATGWLFTKCPPGYPEYMGLTGHEMRGIEAVRCGLATHFLPSHKLVLCLEGLKSELESIPLDKKEALSAIRSAIGRYCEEETAARPDMDAWVEEHFHGKGSLGDVLNSLKNGQSKPELCRETLNNLAERSPTALVMTLTLLIMNRGRPLADVFQTELEAARFMIRHPDYLEGVRARILEKNAGARWRPATIDGVQDLTKGLTGSG